LRRKIIAYVKDKGSNLNIMIIDLKSIISCDVLGLEKSFQGICFGHAFSKACQYVTTDEKLCKDLSYVSIKTAQRDLEMVSKNGRRHVSIQVFPQGNSTKI
jgi:hypothetical protein